MQNWEDFEDPRMPPGLPMPEKEVPHPPPEAREAERSVREDPAETLAFVENRLKKAQEDTKKWEEAQRILKMTAEEKEKKRLAEIKAEKERQQKEEEQRKKMEEDAMEAEIAEMDKRRTEELWKKAREDFMRALAEERAEKRWAMLLEYQKEGWKLVAQSNVMSLYWRIRIEETMKVEEEQDKIKSAFIQKYFELELEQERKRMLGQLDQPKVVKVEEEWDSLLGKKKKRKAAESKKEKPKEEKTRKLPIKRTREDLEAAALKFPEESAAKRWKKSLSPDEPFGRAYEAHDIDFRFDR